MGGDLDPCPELLCGTCPHRDDCPAHRAERELPAEVALLAEQYLALSEAKSQNEKAMKPLKQTLLAFTGEVYRGSSPHCTLSVAKIVPREDSEPKTVKPKAPYLKLEVRRRVA